MPSPQVAEIVAQLREVPLVNQMRLKPFPIAEGRAGFDGFQDWFPVASDVKVEKVGANGVPCEWIVAPGADETRAIEWFHGGCYMFGSVNSHREMAGRMSRATGAGVLLVDYRRAPEHPCPAAVEDALAAYEWLRSRGIAASRITVGGDSAGSGITLAMMTLLRDRAQPLPACGVLFSAWVDLDCTGKPASLPDPLLDQAALRYLGCYYLGDRNPRDPIASPLYANLAGLPPILIQVGSAEFLLDDSHRLVEKLSAAGVQHKLHVWDGLFHVFQLYPPLPEAAEALREMAAFMTANER
jgi:epsilon-lactone hydrolase